MAEDTGRVWYDEWKERFKDAQNNIDLREELTNKCAEEIEVDLEYVGITAVEDMLQVYLLLVPST